MRDLILCSRSVALPVLSKSAFAIADLIFAGSRAAGQNYARVSARIQPLIASLLVDLRAVRIELCGQGHRHLCAVPDFAQFSTLVSPPSNGAIDADGGINYRNRSHERL
jgi:hypothetical protein